MGRGEWPDDAAAGRFPDKSTVDSKTWYDRGMTFVSRHVSVAIDRSPADVYAFAG
jgi:hypothetical protein